MLCTQSMVVGGHPLIVDCFLPAPQTPVAHSVAQVRAVSPIEHPKR